MSDRDFRAFAGHFDIYGSDEKAKSPAVKEDERPARELFHQHNA